MAIKFLANYCKRLGLPGYSSHQFSVSVETELMTTDDVAAESERLYQLLQSAIDEQIQHVGFVPGSFYGMEEGAQPTTVNGHPKAPFNGGPWSCSDKQRELLLKLVEEHKLDKHVIDELAKERFGLPVVRLNKLQASGLIDLILEEHGGSQRPHAPSGQQRGGAR